eukprot:scaffold27_cov355-Prasinococcus_capsulatus_cf.AAC.4
MRAISRDVALAGCSAKWRAPARSHLRTMAIGLQGGEAHRPVGLERGGAALRHGLDVVLVVLRRARVVLALDVLGLAHAARLHEGVQLVVAAGLHHLQLQTMATVAARQRDPRACLGSRRHACCPRPRRTCLSLHESMAAVVAGALEAHEDAVGHGGPLRVARGAVGTDIVPGALLQLAQLHLRQEGKQSDVLPQPRSTRRRRIAELRTTASDTMASAGVFVHSSGCSESEVFKDRVHCSHRPGGTLRPRS